MNSETEEETQKYYILHVPGGGLWGIHPIIAMDFIEKLTRLPISKQFNMSAGSSTGAIATTSVNIPVSKDSSEPRYSAADILHLYKTIGPKIFPPKPMYYPRQIIVDQIARNVHEFTGAFFAWSLNGLDRGLNGGMNYAMKWAHTGLKIKTPFNPIDVKPFRTFHKHLIMPLENKIDKGIDYLIKNSLYDISVLQRILDIAFRYEDTHEAVDLGHTLMTHHVSAMNLTTNKPALFFHFKNPETGETEFVSDSALNATDITLASCAAQSRFEPVKLNNGNAYIDIAHFDTVLTPVISLDRHADKKLDIKLITLGTGQNPTVNPDSLNGMLFLRQMSSEYGAPLFSLPQKYVNDITNMILEHRLGPDNIININLPVSIESQKGDYLNDPRAIQIARYLGIDLDEIARARLPNHDICDSDKENMNNMILFGWLMVIKNLDKLLPLCNELVENAHDMGNITRAEADERINLIQHFTNATVTEDHMTSKHPMRIQDWGWLAFEEIRKRSLREKLKYIFQRATGQKVDSTLSEKKSEEKPRKEKGDDLRPPPPQ